MRLWIVTYISPLGYLFFRFSIAIITVSFEKQCYRLKNRLNVCSIHILTYMFT